MPIQLAIPMTMSYPMLKVDSLSIDFPHRTMTIVGYYTMTDGTYGEMVTKTLRDQAFLDFYATWTKQSDLYVQLQTGETALAGTISATGEPK